MEKSYVLYGYNVHIVTTDDPAEAEMTINDKQVPLVYNPDVKAYAVQHILYGYFKDLDRLAEHIIVSNPELKMHGGGGHHHHP